MIQENESGYSQPLTPREREVAELLRSGLTDSQIADRLQVSTSAVSNHVSEIISKRGVRNRYEAAYWPERPPWWMSALAPLAGLSRRTGTLLQLGPGRAALAVSAGLFAVAVGGAALILALLARGGNAGPNELLLAPAATARALPTTTATAVAVPTPTSTFVAPTARPTGAPEPTLPPPPPTAAPPFAGTRGPVELPGGQATAYFTNAEIVTHREGFDRVMFTFESELPSSRVEYVQPPIVYANSGEPMEIAGHAFLRVGFSPAITGCRLLPCLVPFELTPGLPAAVEVKRTGEEVEDEVTWVIGPSEEVSFRVGTLEDPQRIYVDVLHP